jgi:radical SAM-linked protein
VRPESGFNPHAKAQRLRIRYGRGPAAANIGHFESTKIWVDALQNAGVSVSQSEGKRPQPRVATAAGLPMGVTSEGELLDVVTSRSIDPEALRARLRGQLPEGIVLLDITEVGLGLPSLSMLVRWADYDVATAGMAGTDVGGAVSSFLAAKTLLWEDTRGKKVRRYDIRPLVTSLVSREQCGSEVELSMRLRCDAEGVGRADQVVLALGLPEPHRVHRVRLVLAEASPARSAWRRRGRFL